MPLQNIQDTIKKQAQEKVAEIEEKARKQIQKIESEIEAEKEDLIKKIKDKANLRIKSLQEQNKISLDIKKRNNILSQKLQLLNEARDGAIENLCRLNGVEYESIIKNLLNKVSLNSDTEIFVPESKENESRNALKNVGKNFTIKTDRNLKGGFVIKADKFEINNSFDDIVKQIFEEREMEIVKLLFV